MGDDSAGDAARLDRVLVPDQRVGFGAWLDEHPQALDPHWYLSKGASLSAAVAGAAAVWSNEECIDFTGDWRPGAMTPRPPCDWRSCETRLLVYGGLEEDLRYTPHAGPPPEDVHEVEAAIDRHHAADWAAWGVAQPDPTRFARVIGWAASASGATRPRLGPQDRRGVAGELCYALRVWLWRWEVHRLRSAVPPTSAALDHSPLSLAAAAATSLGCSLDPLLLPTHLPADPRELGEFGRLTVRVAAEAVVRALVAFAWPMPQNLGHEDAEIRPDAFPSAATRRTHSDSRSEAVARAGAARKLAPRASRDERIAAAGPIDRYLQDGDPNPVQRAADEIDRPYHTVRRWPEVRKGVDKARAERDENELDMRRRPR